jgi:C4-dicarboxylate transporter DctM subunit
LWNAYYDCLFFCINQTAYDQFTDEQKAVIDANAAKAVEYQKAINRKNVDAVVEKYKTSGEMAVTDYEDIDIDSFKQASAGVEDWFVQQLVSSKGMSEEDAKAFVALFE